MASLTVMRIAKRATKSDYFKLVAIAVVLMLVACEDLGRVLNDSFSTNGGNNSSGSTSSGSPNGLDTARSYENRGLCRHVVDGDSLYIAGQEKQIRLWGVDAPERDESGYKRAKEALVKLALKKNIHCSTQDIDKYGRVVARCFLADGQEINQLLLASGVSQEYCRFSKNHYGFCR